MSNERFVSSDTMPDPGREMVGRFHHDGHDTEFASARRVTPRSGTQRAGVLDHLRDAGDYGSTDYETWLALDLIGIRCAHHHVAGTRREELIADGWPIIDSGRRRPTNTGCNAIAWKYTP